MSSQLSFGAWLRKRRKEYGYTQEELGALAGCSADMVRKMEAGSRRPSRQVAELLAQTLELTGEEREAFLRLARLEIATPALITAQQAEAEDGKAAPADGHPARASALGLVPSQLPVPGAQAPARARAHGLPSPLTDLVGRENEVADLCRMLATRHARLVTLTGPGGVGKTRLAIEAAWSLLNDPALGFGGDVYFVPLAPIADPALVPSALAGAFGLRDQSSQPFEEMLAAHLAGREAFLLLDNFEQVSDAAPFVVSLLHAAPGLQVLVTSRASLSVRGEQRFPVPPLALPPVLASREALPPDDSEVEVLSRVPSVKLFVQQAQAVNPSFALSQENARAVAEICTRLDGLPLAIELISARTRLYSPQAILPGLVGKLTHVKGSTKDLPARHQTLRDAIGWSYDLLDPSERTLFGRLGVFAGGFTVTAVEAICNATNDLPMDIVDGLGSLLDKSLIRHEPENGAEPRFSMLETIREYAKDCLDVSDEAQTVRELHLEYYLGLALAGEPHFKGKEELTWLNLFRAEQDNFRSALAFALSKGRSDTALQLVSALGHFWFMDGHIGEGRRWCAEAVARANGTRSALVAKALNIAGNLAFYEGDYAGAVPLYERSLDISQESGDTGAMSPPINNLGLIAHVQGEHARARDLYRRYLALERERGNLRGIALALDNLGRVAYETCDYDESAVLHEESLALYRELGSRSDIAHTLVNLALLALVQGEGGEAEMLLSESVRLYRDLGDRVGIAEAIEALGALAAEESRPVRAAWLFSAADKLRTALAAPRPPFSQAEYDRHMTRARALLDQQAWEEACAAGRAATLDELVAYALQSE